MVHQKLNTYIKQFWENVESRCIRGYTRDCYIIFSVFCMLEIFLSKKLTNIFLQRVSSKKSTWNAGTAGLILDWSNLSFFFTGVVNIFFFYLSIFPFIFVSWRLITLQYCSGFWHTLTWISHGYTCVPHPDPPSHLPLHLIPLGLPSAPAPSTFLMHPTWAGDLFHPW